LPFVAFLIEVFGVLQQQPARPLDGSQVAQLLHESSNAGWTQTAAVGEGEEYRAEFNGKAASALLLDGALVHGSVVAGVA
jgi:hypothetical protein